MLAIIIIAITIALLAIARKSQPAKNKSGTSIVLGTRPNQPKDQPLEFLTVATYNIQTGKNLQGKRNLLASARVMAHADLIGVQEVYASGFDGLNSGQTERLAKFGGFDWLFSATRRRWFREHRGNALLSKMLVSDWRIEMLPDQSGKNFRNMMVAKVHWHNETFHIINTHLHTRGGREDQLERVLQEFSKYPRAILLGDFNSHATSPSLANALKNIEITDAIAAAKLDLDNPERIDWILTKGFKIETGEMLEKGVSDHPYYQVSLSYKN